MSARRCEICRYAANITPGARDGRTYCDFWQFKFNDYDCCQLFQDRTADGQITIDEIIGRAE